MMTLANPQQTLTLRAKRSAHYLRLVGEQRVIGGINPARGVGQHSV